MSVFLGGRGRNFGILIMFFCLTSGCSFCFLASGADLGKFLESTCDFFFFPFLITLLVASVLKKLFNKHINLLLCE